MNWRALVFNVCVLGSITFAVDRHIVDAPVYVGVIISLLNMRGAANVASAVRGTTLPPPPGFGGGGGGDIGRMTERRERLPSFMAIAAGGVLVAVLVTVTLWMHRHIENDWWIPVLALGAALVFVALDTLERRVLVQLLIRFDERLQRKASP